MIATGFSFCFQFLPFSFLLHLLDVYKLTVRTLFQSSLRITESSLQLKMKAFTFVLLLVIACAVATPAGVKQNAKKKLYEETSKDAPTEVIREDDTDSVSIRAEAKCGIGHGRCPTNHCCSLANTCGRSAAHCNVSLGCRRKFGSCH